MAAASRQVSVNVPRFRSMGSAMSRMAAESATTDSGAWRSRKTGQGASGPETIASRPGSVQNTQASVNTTVTLTWARDQGPRRARSSST
jgi:hypothetical protein